MAEKNNQEKQQNQQTPNDVFIQTLLNEVSQKSVTIAQLNATISDLESRYNELIDKFKGMPENHSTN